MSQSSTCPGDQSQSTDRFFQMGLSFRHLDTLNMGCVQQDNRGPHFRWNSMLDMGVF